MHKNFFCEQIKEVHNADKNFDSVTTAKLRQVNYVSQNWIFAETMRMRVRN